MNPLHATQIKSKSHSRSGLSIIEVLTSIVVAMIGVFGVMILIPFAVKQAQTGLDSDAGVMLGRNTYSQFEVGGYRFPTNWGVYDAATASPARIVAYSPFDNWDSDQNGFQDAPPMPPQILSIDPLGVAESGIIGTPVATAYGNATFPYNQRHVVTPSAATYPFALQFRGANLGTPAGVTMEDFDGDGFVDAQGIALARRMCRTSDDLVFGEAVDELLGPEQYFDQGAGPLRRQSNGRLSWSSIVVPFKDDPALFGTNRWSYKMYILIYKNRKTFIDAVPDPDDQMASILVTNTGTANPVSTVFLEAAIPPVSVQGAISRDDWVMLINQNGTLEVGFDRQVQFYRVINVADQSTTTAANLTLDGPPFTFSGPGFGQTFMVHLQNVVAVYEQTFVPEAESTWTTN